MINAFIAEQKYLHIASNKCIEQIKDEWGYLFQRF